MDVHPQHKNSAASNKSRAAVLVQAAKDNLLSLAVPKTNASPQWKTLKGYGHGYEKL